MTTPPDNLPIARARFGAPSLWHDRPRIVVDACPYCGRIHYHLYSPDAPMQRLADCFQGEYVLTFEDEQKASG